jgi:hypothetical protein
MSNAAWRPALSIATSELNSSGVSTWGVRVAPVSICDLASLPQQSAQRFPLPQAHVEFVSGDTMIFLLLGVPSRRTADRGWRRLPNTRKYKLAISQPLHRYTAAPLRHCGEYACRIRHGSPCCDRACHSLHCHAIAIWIAGASYEADTGTSASFW